MATSADIKKALSDSTPLYVVAGAGDLAVEKLREVQARLAILKVEPKAVQNRVSGSLLSIQGDVRTLPDRAQAFALSSVGKAAETYEGLAKRGKDVVGRIRRQQASQELTESSRTTVRRAKGTETTARKAVAGTAASAKATGTAARSTASAAAKTAKATERAVKDGAGKVG